MGCFIKHSKYRWKNGVIPYQIDNNHFPVRDNNGILNPKRITILSAINHWEQNTVIQFFESNSHKDRVIFKSSDTSCSSSVGRRGGIQEIRCNLNNFGLGSIIHEIGHAVGLYHEHSRSDRDNFITINFRNITEDNKPNFDKEKNSYDIGNYDYGSIMHYGNTFISINIPPGSKSTTIGQRTGLSNGDINTIEQAYNRRSEFYKVYEDGKMLRLDRFNWKWRGIWDKIITGNFGSSFFSDLLFYDKNSGEAIIYSTNGEGDIGFLSKHTGWRKTWKEILTININNDDFSDLFFYDNINGEVEIYKSIGKGNFVWVNRHSWGKDWDIVLTGNFKSNRYTDFLFYNKNNGWGKFMVLDRNCIFNELYTHVKWRKTWDIIVSGNFSGNHFSDLLFYDKEKGEVEIYSTNGEGNINFRGRYNLGNNWDKILVIDFLEGPYSELLFYDQKNGIGAFYRIDDSEGLKVIKEHKSWRKTWDFIIPGFYSKPKNNIFKKHPSSRLEIGEDLLFYDRNA